MTISSIETRKILAPYIERLQNSVANGIRDYNENYASVRHLHSPWSRPNLIRDHIVARIKKEFEGVDGVKFLQRQGLFLLFVKNRIGIRVKKLNHNLLTSNHPTQQVLNFSNQLSLPFPDICDNTVNINLGYVPNNLWTGYDKIVITCPNGTQSIAWHIDITPSNEIEIPIKPISINTETQKKRIRLKSNSSKNKKAV